MEHKYIPGVCNIGPEEIKMRSRVGWMGLAATMLVGGMLFYLGAPATTRLVLVLPAFVAAIAFLQAVMHFCVAFASSGLFNMDKAAGQTESVEKAEYRKADQKKAVSIYIYSALIAIVVAVAAYLA